MEADWTPMGAIRTGRRGSITVTVPRAAHLRSALPIRVSRHPPSPRSNHWLPVVSLRGVMLAPVEAPTRSPRVARRTMVGANRYGIVALMAALCLLSGCSMFPQQATPVCPPGQGPDYGYVSEPCIYQSSNAYAPSAPRTASTRDAPCVTGYCGPVNVRGYTRKDGTYVRPYTRSRPRR